MIILIDLTSLADNFSGLERFTLNITRNLLMEDRKDKFILIFKNNIHEKFKELILKENVEYKVIRGKNKLIFNQLILPYNLYKIKANKYIFLAFPSPILFRKKGIWNAIHDLTAFLYPKTMTKSSMIYFKYSIINAMQVSEKIITVSESSKSDIKEKFSNQNIFVVNNGISEVFTKFKFCNKEDEKVVKQYNLPEKYIMCLGTVEPRKNLSLLIEAYLELRIEGKIEDKLVLVGRRGWKIEEILKTINAKKYQDDILFTGFVDDEYLPYIYLNSKVFVFPSIYEGFGIPPIEAMFMRTKVLVSDIDVLQEVCGDDIEYFKSNSINDLKFKLVKLLNTKEYNYLTNKEKASKFKWKNESEKVLNLLMEKN